MRVPHEIGHIRGRETEWDLVLKLLDNARRGKSGILLLEGEPGIGKSALLAAAAAAANAQGLSLATSVAEELGWFSFASLVGLDRADGRAPGAELRPVGKALARLEELGSAGPVLVSLDDLHYADPATSQALRTLPGMLAPYPFAWLLAKSSRGGSQDSDLLFEALGHQGAARARLRPLADEAQIAVATDILGAVPDARLMERAACAAGNPLALTEFLRGLVEEKGVSIAGNRARLISDEVPGRFQSVMRDRLKWLAAPTRHFLAAGATLGRSFRLEDAAEMLGESPASLLAPVEEALAARIVDTRPDAIAFQHDLVWRVVSEQLPQPVAEALHRQAGEMLLARGGSAVPAAHHLLEAARHSDPCVLAALDAATAEALCSSPRAAAEVAVRTLELTPATERQRVARTVTAVRALTAAGLWETAGELAQPALAVPTEARSCPPLRCALASLHAMSGRQTEALIEAESIMADPEASFEDLDEAKIVLLQALTALRDSQKLAQVATTILAQRGTECSDIIVAALLARALVAWDAGSVTDALDFAAEAVRNRAGGPSPEGRRFQPELFLASRLIDVRKLAAAKAVMTNPFDRIDEPVPVSWCPASPGILRARLALATGHLDEAAAEAGSALVGSDATGMRLHSRVARSILATVALRRGDLHAAAMQIESSCSPVPHFVSAYEIARSDLVSAQVEEAQSGPAAAVAVLAGVYDTVHEHRYLLMSDPVSAPWLVRASLAAGDEKRAEAITTTMSRLRHRNPAVSVFRACADHAQGVFESNRACLEEAVVSHEDPWARASAAEDLGALLASAGSRRDAVARLGAALEVYEGTRAERDAARIRRRLRRLGVRRGHWTSAKRPLTGWDSLTDTDRNITRLVAEGFTNQQVADQLYISIHTVAYHLRQVFRKLGISSRVGLARVALEKAAGGEESGP